MKNDLPVTSPVTDPILSSCRLIEWECSTDDRLEIARLPVRKQILVGRLHGLRIDGVPAEMKADDRLIPKEEVERSVRPGLPLAMPRRTSRPMVASDC